MVKNTRPSLGAGSELPLKAVPTSGLLSLFLACSFPHIYLTCLPEAMPPAMKVETLILAYTVLLQQQKEINIGYCTITEYKFNRSKLYYIRSDG